MAERFGIGKDTVARIWRDHELKPWKVDTFKLSNDPSFEEKLVDVVGLYMNPPERAVVFSFDEKTQVQALDRTQPSLPMKPGRAGTMTHDYKRNGTTDLFAALNVATGEVLYDSRKRTPPTTCWRSSSSSTCTCPATSTSTWCWTTCPRTRRPRSPEWLAHPKRARWHLHFTPTRSSWLNLVERWFNELTDRRLRRGAFTSVAALIDAIETWTEHWNDDPKPFVWHKPAEEIIAKVAEAERHSTSQIRDAALALPPGFGPPGRTAVQAGSWATGGWASMPVAAAPGADPDPDNFPPPPASGIRPRIVGALARCRLVPRCCHRWRRPGRPCSRTRDPRGRVTRVEAGAVVRHLDRSAALVRPRPDHRRAAAPACLAAFCSASRQQKYTAASTCSERPMPSASTPVGSAARRSRRQRLGETAVHEQRRVDAVRQGARRSAWASVTEPLSRARASAASSGDRFNSSRTTEQVEPEGGQPLLRAIVQVAGDAMLLLVGGRHHAGPGRPELVDGGGQRLLRPV